jgi:hypothetical protein
MEAPGTLLRRCEVKLIASLLAQRYRRIPKADELLELSRQWDTQWRIFYFFTGHALIDCRHCGLSHCSGAMQWMYWAVCYRLEGESYSHVLHIGAECLEQVLSICRAEAAREAFGLCRACGAFEICRDLFEQVCCHVDEIESARIR